MTKLEAWLEKAKTKTEYTSAHKIDFVDSLTFKEAIAVIEKLKEALETYQRIYDKQSDIDTADKALAINPEEL